MCRFTYFVVQPFFIGIRNKLVPGDAVEARNRDDAHRLCEAFAAKGGALAFSRSGDPDTGDFDEAVVLCAYGQVPEAYAREAA